MDVMSAATPEVQPEVTGQPVFTPLDPEAALQPCDGHASKAVNAVVSVLLPSGGIIELCGNCSRKMGYEHTNIRPESRSKGDDHA